MGKIFWLWCAIFLLAGGALATASQYLITPIWPVNFIAAFYIIKLRRKINNYASIGLMVFTAVMAASIIFDEHQPPHIQLIMSSLCGIQVSIFVFTYYWIIKNISKFSYKRTALLTLPCFISTFIASILFVFVPVEGLWYLMFFDYFLEQIATGFALMGILYGLSEWKKVTLINYCIIAIASLGQYLISINPLFYNCFILPLVNVYFAVKYHFKRFVFVMGILALICSVYLVLPLAGQYWREDEIYLFSHLSTYRMGIASFTVIFLILSELQMRHRGLTQYLEKVSFYDDLTNLKNRRYLREKLLAENAQIKNGAIMLTDLDNFKKINDQYGHNVGDQVLKIMAKHIQTAVPINSHIFRWGGEEFLIVLSNIKDQEALQYYAAQVIENCKVELNIDNIQITCSASMGIKPFENLNFDDYYKHIEVADQMLYQAKAEGKKQFKLYHEISYT